jgi:NhaP-type Na+/H+ or K+/H+ antiporter
MTANNNLGESSSTSILLSSSWLPPFLNDDTNNNAAAARQEQQPERSLTSGQYAYDKSQSMYAVDEDEEMDRSLFFILFSALLALVLILSKQLHETDHLKSVLSEAALVLLVGILAGFLFHFFVNEPGYGHHDNDEEQVFRALLSFSPEIFFMGLLPPILFNSGYQLRRELFYRHIAPIILFAAVGTTISAGFTAMALLGIRNLGWLGSFHPTLIELFTFGSLIAATDTVSVIAVLQAKRVDPHLFYVVFGESALNDAVALVLFNTFADVLLNNQQPDLWNTIKGFAVVFSMAAIGSPLLGMLFGFLAALVFKKVDLRNHKMLELSIYLLCMYVPFIIAECLHLSGIVTIFFSGLSVRRYAAPNVSHETYKAGGTIFKVAAFVAETCIFLELGMSVFGFYGSFHWQFIFWALLCCLMGRAVAIYPLCYFHNLSLSMPSMTGGLGDDTDAEATSFDDDSSCGGGGIRKSSSNSIHEDDFDDGQYHLHQQQYPQPVHPTIEEHHSYHEAPDAKSVVQKIPASMMMMTPDGKMLVKSRSAEPYHSESSDSEDTFQPVLEQQESSDDQYHHETSKETLRNSNLSPPPDGGMAALHHNSQPQQQHINNILLHDDSLKNYKSSYHKNFDPMDISQHEKPNLQGGGERRKHYLQHKVSRLSSCESNENGNKNNRRGGGGRYNTGGDLGGEEYSNNSSSGDEASRISFFLGHGAVIPPRRSGGGGGGGRTNNINNNSSNNGNLRRKSKRKRTPMKRKDRKISLEMAHILWFAGLRGAVAYACVREFPDVYGHDDEFTAATMFIVLFTIIVMGGLTEFMLEICHIDMNVDEEEYMNLWRREHKLKGFFHDFGT